MNETVGLRVASENRLLAWPLSFVATHTNKYKCNEDRVSFYRSSGLADTSGASICSAWLELIQARQPASMNKHSQQGT